MQVIYLPVLVKKKLLYLLLIFIALPSYWTFAQSRYTFASCPGSSYVDEIPNIFSVGPVSVPCGSTANVSFIIDTYNYSPNTVYNYPPRPGYTAASFTLPAGWQWVSTAINGSYYEFGSTFIRHTVTLKPDPYTAGTATVKNAFPCNGSFIYSQPYTFQISRTVPTPVLSSNALSFCAGSTVSNVTITNALPGATYTWSPTDFGIQVTKNNVEGTSVNITSAVAGSIIVRGNSCGVTSTYKELPVSVVGPVTSPTTVTWSEGVACTNHHVRFSASAVGATSYQWQVSGATIISGQGTSLLGIRLPADGRTVEIWAQGQNSCGTPTGSLGYYATSAMDCEPQLGNQRRSSEAALDSSKASLTTSTIDVYPNPGSDLLHIKLLDAVSNDTDFTISLYDSQGTIQRALTVKQDKLQLDVSGLPSGIYYLSVSYRGKTMGKQVVVAH